MTDPQPHDLPRSIGGQPPSGYFVLVSPDSGGAGPDLATVLRVVRSGWLTILVVGVVTAAVTWGGSLLLKDLCQALNIRPADYGGLLA